MVHLDIEEHGRVRTVQLPEGRHVIGRAVDADVRLESTTVSRVHAAIEVSRDRIYVEDLGSLWGTYLGTRRLVHGDRRPFEQGELLRVAQVEVWAHDAPRPQLTATDAGMEATDKGGRIITGFESHRRTLPMLRHLFQVFSTVEEGHSIEQEACLFVQNWVDADRVCLFEADEPGVAPNLRSWWSREPLNAEKPGISTRVLNGALETDAPTRWSRGEEELDSMDTRHRFDIHSAIAIPFQGTPPIRGVLYADRRREAKPYSDDDVEILTATATAVAMRRAYSITRLETHKAAKIQRSMLPRELPTIRGYELEAGLHMCQGVGGDLYDAFCRGNDHCFFSVGDVSGKGLPASLIMGATCYLVRALEDLKLSPLEIYKRVHSNLLAKYRMRQYVALFLAELDRETGQLRCVVAGVPRPMLIRASGKVEKLPVTAYAAALIDLDEPPPEEVTVTLEPGDVLAVYTDGYPDSTPDGDDYLDHRVEDQLVRDHALPLGEIRRRLDELVENFVGHAGPSDDRTLLLLRRE
jgi:serine phosphatase RsbU (regulator of sigma subunit)